MPDFLEIREVDPVQLRAMLEHAKAMKLARMGRPKAAPDDDCPLDGIMAALIFEKPSTRTRVSFDVGIRQLGGQTMVLSGKELQLGQGESVADTARVISRYADIAMIRTFGASTIQEFARSATIPVINGLTNHSHPCQIMADVMTFEEHAGPIDGRRVAWVGAGSNVCNSFIEAAAQLRFDMVFSGPLDLSPSSGSIDFARSSGVSVEIEPDLHSAVAGADVVVTDAWYSMHDDPALRQSTRNKLRPYQVNSSVMQAAGPDAVFMHCLPAHREEEVTSEVMDGGQSLVFEEAENRLHAQKAILRWCLGR